MLRCHWISLRAVAHPTEDPGRVHQAMAALTGMAVEELEPRLEVSWLESHHGGRMAVLEAGLHRARDIRSSLATLLDSLPVRTALLERLEERTDEAGVVHMRFCKQRALQGEVDPVDEGDTIQVRIRPEVHPGGRENVLAEVRRSLAGPWP